jgi:glycolate oxidase
VGAARKRLVEEGLLPEGFRPMLEGIVDKGNPFGEDPHRRTEVYPSKEARAQEGAEVLLFLGCVPSYQDTRIVPSVMRALDRAGVRYATTGEQERCCGYLAYLVGAESEFIKAMEANLEIWGRSRPQKIVTTCAGCYKALKELYPKYSGDRVPETNHLVEFMDGLIQQGVVKFQGSFPAKVAYHDPCDLGRHMGIFEPPRRILRAIPGVEFLEFPMNRLLAKCCGGGGGLKAFDHSLSDDIGYRRIQQAKEIGAEVVVSACPSCKRTLQSAAARLKREERIKIQVMDIAEVLAKAI